MKIKDKNKMIKSNKIENMKIKLKKKKTHRGPKLSLKIKNKN